MTIVKFIATLLFSYNLNANWLDNHDYKTREIPLGNLFADLGMARGNATEGDLSLNNEEITSRRGSLIGGERGNYIFPMSRLEVNPLLDRMAVILNDQAFPGLTRNQTEQFLFIIDIGNDRSLLPKPQADAIHFDGRIRDFGFVNEQLLRVQVIEPFVRRAGLPAPPLGVAAYHYEYYNLDSGARYGLSDFLPYFEVVHQQHIVDNIYIIAERPQGQKQVNYHVVEFQPAHEKYRYIQTLPANHAKAMLHTLPVVGANVSTFGYQKFIFQYYLTENARGEPFVYQFNGKQPVIIGDPDHRVTAERSTWVRNSLNWTVERGNGDMIRSFANAETGERIDLKPGIADYTSHAVETKSGLVTVNSGTDKQISLTSFGGASEVLINEPLKNIDVKDGAVSGLRFHPNTGRLDMVQVFFDSSFMSLTHGHLKNPEGISLSCRKLFIR